MSPLRAGALLCCAAAAIAAPESGALFLSTYTPRAYSASPQNWAVVQDARGIMYVANTEGVLEFDGASWRKIPVANGAAAVALAVGPDGVVYVGAQGGFGYLKSRGLETPRYVSLAPPRPRFAHVWSVAVHRGEVYFGAYQAIFRYSPASRALRHWTPDKVFGRLFAAGGDLYTTTQGAGLVRLSADSWVPVPGGSGFAPLDVRAVLAADGALTVVTRTSIRRLTGGAFLDASPDAASLLQKASAHAALPLDDGSLAIATANGGLLLLDAALAPVRLYTREHGLLSEALTGLALDREGGLWLASRAGVQRTDLALTRFGRPEGLAGSVYALARHQGLLYAGADVGLFALRTGALAARFEPLPLTETVVALASMPGALLVGAVRGVYALRQGRLSLALRGDAVYDIVASRRDPAAAFAACRSGVHRMRWTGAGWQNQLLIPAAGAEFRSVAEDAGGAVWAATRDEIVRFDSGSLERFGAAAGVPAGFKNVYFVRGRIVFATAAGLLRFDPALRRFTPSNLAPGFESRPVSQLREQPGGGLWITGEGYHGLLRSQWQPAPLLRSEIGEIYAAWPEPDGVLWASGADGFVVRARLRDATPPLQVFVRAARTPAGMAGAAIAWRDNSPRIEFAAPFFEDPSKVEYQTRLDGLDRDWTPWSADAHREYAHLFEGAYAFRVRARTPRGDVAEAAALPFRVLPPWYRTWWAWGAYLVLAAAGVYGLLRWRVRQLERDKARLEGIVEERTAEVRRQRDEIQVERERTETLLLNILPAPVADELKQRGAVEPQDYEGVTVLFTDFVGFTLSSETMPAGELVSSLHEYFTVFDEIVEEFGLEKLKTIGDAYMLASGLPRPRASHAVDAVRAALRMVEAVKGLSARGDGAVWDVRIGLHSGPVAAGVVGVRKFAYDIWGNTVNLASRMESSGAPGRVNVSERTHELVRDFFECEPRGRVATKDKRDLEMYFVLGARAELRDPEAFSRYYQGRFGQAPTRGAAA